MRQGHKFKLVNGIGQELLLEEDPLLYNVTGIGLSFSGSPVTVSDGFFGDTDREMQQNAVSGSLLFRSASYRAFVQFCDTDELKLGYLPYGGSNWFFSSARLTRLAKSDLDKHLKALLCDVEFSLMSPWARENPSRASISPSESSLSYPQEYPYTYGTDAAGSVTFDINGDLDGAYTIECAGPLTAPVVTLYKQINGAWIEVGKTELSVDIASAETLRISVRPNDSYIEKVAGDVTTDLTGSISLLGNAFARPPRGHCKLTLESGSPISTVATVRVYDYYRSV